MRTQIALAVALIANSLHVVQAKDHYYQVDVVEDHHHPAYQNSDKRWYEENDGQPIPVKHDENGTAFLSVRDQTGHPAFKGFHKRFYEHLDGLPVPVKYDENGTALLSITPDDDASAAGLSARAAPAKPVVVPGVYICARRNWGGPCYWDPVTIGRCYGLRDPPPNIIGAYGEGSFGIDHGIKCKIHGSESCGFMAYNWESAWLQWPGVAGRPGDMLYIPADETQGDWTMSAYNCEKL